MCIVPVSSSLLLMIAACTFFDICSYLKDKITAVDWPFFFVFAFVCLGAFWRRGEGGIDCCSGIAVPDIDIACCWDINQQTGSRSSGSSNSCSSSNVIIMMLNMSCSMAGLWCKNRSRWQNKSVSWFPSKDVFAEHACDYHLILLLPVSLSSAGGNHSCWLSLVHWSFLVSLRTGVIKASSFQGPESWRLTTVKWRQFSRSNCHSTIGTQQTEYHEALPLLANDEVRCDCTFANDGNASWYLVCRVPMAEWRLDCENCHHLTVVGLHDTGPRC